MDGGNTKEGTLILTREPVAHWSFVISSSYCYVEAIGAVKWMATERMYCLIRVSLHFRSDFHPN